MIFSPKYVICAKMRTIFLVLFWVFVAKLPTIRGADDCQFTAQKVNIDDTSIGIQIYNVSVPSSATFLSFYIQNTGGAVDTTIAKTYFDVNVTEDSLLTVSTTQAFENIGKDADTSGSSLLVAMLYAEINCEGASTDVPLIIAVTDTFKNHPVFNKESYVYSVPMPIMQRTDVTLYGDEIEISDINFSNLGMTLAITPDDFQVTASQTDSKHFTAVFRAKRILQFTENQTYILTAVNTGNKSSQVPLTIVVDSSEGLDSPSFAKSYYSFEYSYKDPTSLVPKDGDTVITSEKSKEARYQIDGELASYFLVTFNNDTKTFVLATNPDNQLPTNLSSQVVLTLSYATDATANAILLINILDSDIVPTFSSNYYTGSYSIETNEISWSQSMNIEDAVDVELTGDKSSLFTIDNSTYKITPVSPLSKTDFGENSNILFTIIAKSSSKKEARAVVVISLETVELDKLQFDNVYYSATYSEANGAGIVTLDNDIGFSGLTDFTDIEINVDDAYSGNFKIELDSSTWKVSVTAVLNETTLKNNSELAIVLTATKAGVSGSATAVLIMKLPEKVEIKFGNSYYSGTYLQGTDTDYVTMDQDIIVTGAEPGDLSIVVEGFSSNFELTYNDSSSSYKLNVKEKLNSTILNSNSILLLKVTAAVADITATSSVLVLDLPEQTAELAFAKYHYEGTYTVDGKVVLEEGGIQVKKSEDLNPQFSIEGFDGNFELIYNKASSSYVINVTSALNSSVLEANTKLVLTITVFVADTELADYAVLVLDLSQKTSLLSFEKNHYTAIYVVDSESSASINITDGPIKLYNEDNLSLEFSYEDFDENFELVYEDTTSSYIINVTSPLNTSILETHTKLVLTITALATDTGLADYAVLVLELPRKTSLLAFEKSHYSAIYVVDSETKSSIQITDGPIKLYNEDNLNLHFSYEDFDENFKLVYEDTTSSYVINVTSPLNTSILETHTKLVLTITALAIDTKLVDSAVLVLELSQKTSLLSFEKSHYSALYVVDSENRASISITDGPIKIYNEDSLSLKFSYEDYDDNFQLVYHSATSSYIINVTSPLNASILETHTKLVVTITALAIDTKLVDSAVLVLELPQKTSLLSFEKSHYSAIYVADSEDRASINITDGPIKLYNEDNLSLQFSYEAFDENLELLYDSATSSYIINVTTPLNTSILETHSKLVLTITASSINAELVDYAVLVLDLPQETSMLSFEKSHYSAIYTEVSASGASVKVTDGPIKLYNEDNLSLQFSYEGFDKNFQLSYDKASGTYGLSVLKPLNDTLINSNTELIITIAASTSDGTWITNMVMVIKLPTDNEKALAFDKEYYTASYQTDPEPLVKLDDAIVLNTKGYSNIQVTLTGYNENFELEYDSAIKNYSIKVKNPLNDTVLTLNSQLLIVITASDPASDATISSVLVLDLPSYTIAAFDSDYYAAEYLLSNDSDTDEVLVIEKKIMVKSTEYAQIVFAGYEENFKATCDAVTLECTVAVKTNLNSSILSSNDELLVTLIASNDGKSSIGKSVLLLKLPKKTSTFSFSKQHYRAAYSIQKSSDEKATVALGEDIYLEGINSTYAAIALDEYSPYFEIKWDTSAWKLNVLKNLEAAILSNKSDLVISLTASKTDQSDPDYAKAVLLIKLPDDATLAFDKLQYSGEYVISDPQKPKVVLDIDSDINISDSDNSIIILDSFTDNFDITLDSDSNWIVDSTNPLNASILTQYSELKLLMTITKIGVRYDQAGLTIKLPTISFSERVYSGIYSVDDDEVGHVSVSDIMMDNVDPSYIQVNLTTYNEYLYTEWDDSKWTVKVAKPLPASTADKLVTNLVAVRTTDSKILATSTLVISLVTSNSTDVPRFSTFTFYGAYEASDPPTIKLRELISLADDNTASISNIYIDTSSEYASNFSLKKEDNGTYSISIEDPLSQDVIDEVTSIVFTLVATTVEGTNGYATLAIALPKAVRNISVQLEDQEILYTGTYENGVFTAPDIHLITNSTDDDDISVEITNELGIDGKYFTYNYTDKILYVQVAELPDDVVNETSVIPLKLAITDRTTQDTVYAVLNVEITASADDGGGGGGVTTYSKGLIASTAILAILLILLLIAVFLFWYLKLRKNRYVQMTDEEINKTTKTTTFTKNETKKPVTGLSSNSFRRPTGLPAIVTTNNLEESSSDHVIPGTPYPGEFEKKVAFNDAIEKIDENEDEDNEDPERLQSVADRRPTEFVFGYPLEKGIFDTPDERRESSDYNISLDTYDPNRKKSVAFDDNVERMPIDPDNESDDDGNGGIYRTEAELQIKDEEQLPSQIFKAIL